MMTLKLAVVMGLVLGVVGFVLSALYWPHLPDPMPTHFDGNGIPNGWGSRALGALLLPMMIVGFGVLFAVLARISPQGFDLSPFKDTVAILAVALEVFLLVVHALTLRAASSGQPLQNGMLMLGIGALFAVIGNRFGKVRRNFFIGIRTPWTIADEEVWLRTHRLAGKLFVAAGLLTMVLALVPHALPMIVGLLIVAGLVPAIYSYVIYQQLHRDQHV